MSATIIPFPLKDRSKLPRAEDPANQAQPPGKGSADFNPREEAIYRMVKQMILERLTAQDE